MSGESCEDTETSKIVLTLNHKNHALILLKNKDANVYIAIIVITGLIILAIFVIIGALVTSLLKFIKQI